MCVVFPCIVGSRIVTAPENQTITLQVDESNPNGLRFIPVNVTFSCLASGSPRPIVTWSSDAYYSDIIIVELFPSDSEIRSNLTLVDVQPSITEIGIKCSAENEAGATESTVGLQTLCKYA